MKLPIRYEHIAYEGDDFYDADGEYVTAEQLVEYVNAVRPEAARIDAALRACDGLSTLDLAGNKRGWLAELCNDAYKLDEPYKAGAQKCLKIVQEMRAVSLDSEGVDYGILSRVEYRLQKVVDMPVAPLPSIPSPLARREEKS